MKASRIKVLSTLATLTMVLLPTDAARWLDTATPVRAEPLTVLRGTVARNATLASALGGNVTPRTVQLLVEVARPVYDLARLSVGRPFGLVIGPDGLLKAFTYGIDEVRTLRVFRSGESFAAEVVRREIETRTATASGIIESSLFGAVARAGEQDQLALDLADIFAWDVDFNTELRKGDAFRVAVEKTYVEGRFSGYGRVLAAELTRGTRVLRAVRFDSDASSGYYDPSGTPLRKAFLRSPLKFSAITSRFTSARFHPILHVMTTHYGVDFAAPTGTPVLASADGVVFLAGWSDGFGKTVGLRHANGFETLYGHLSRIDVTRGQRVTQGTRVGAVGMTGLATGPHLDYRMRRDRVFVDPLKLQSPPAEPIPSADRPAFDRVRDERVALLDGAPALRTAALP